MCIREGRHGNIKKQMLSTWSLKRSLVQLDYRVVGDVRGI